MRLFKIIAISAVLAAVFTAILYYFVDYGFAGSVFIGLFTIMLSFVWPEWIKIKKEQKQKTEG